MKSINEIYIVYLKNSVLRLVATLACTSVFVSVCNGMAERSFSQIEAAAAQIPTMREFHQRGDISDHSGGFKAFRNYAKNRLIPIEALDAALDRFFITMQKDLMIPQQWQGGNERLNDLLDPTNISFVPYAQKLVLKEEDTFMCKGDLHGDVHSLIAFMRQLQEQGYTSKDNEFKIINPRFHLIFLGDYVDRGLWGAEVIYLLLRLKTENPGQVFLVRGNHEDCDVTKVYGFHNEFTQKFKWDNEEVVQNVYNKIAKLYECLPLVLYVGSPAAEGIDFIQCCHGGIEMGYNPKKFLKSADCIKFEAIRELKRATECAHWELACMDHTGEIRPLKDCCCDFMPSSPTFPYPIGFLWHDFLTAPDGLTSLGAGRGFACDKDLTHATLKAACSKKSRLCAIIRAHQHSQRDPLMKLLLNNQGCAILWDHTGPASYVKNGMVITLLLSPDSLGGLPNFAGNKFSGFNYDTSLLVTTGDGLDAWKLLVINNQMYDRRFKSAL